MSSLSVEKCSTDSCIFYSKEVIAFDVENDIPNDNETWFIMSLAKFKKYRSEVQVHRLDVRRFPAEWQ